MTCSEVPRPVRSAPDRDRVRAGGSRQRGPSLERSYGAWWLLARVELDVLFMLSAIGGGVRLMAFIPIPNSLVRQQSIPIKLEHERGLVFPPRYE